MLVRLWWSRLLSVSGNGGSGAINVNGSLYQKILIVL